MQPSGSPSGKNHRSCWLCSSCKQVVHLIGTCSGLKVLHFQGNKLSKIAQSILAPEAKLLTCMYDVVKGTETVKTCLGFQTCKLIFQQMGDGEEPRLPFSPQVL